MVWMANSAGCVEYANRQWCEYTGLSIEQAGHLGWDAVLHPEDREANLESLGTGQAGRFRI